MRRLEYCPLVGGAGQERRPLCRGREGGPLRGDCRQALAPGNLEANSDEGAGNAPSVLVVTRAGRTSGTSGALLSVRLPQQEGLGHVAQTGQGPPSLLHQLSSPGKVLGLFCDRCPWNFDPTFPVTHKSGIPPTPADRNKDQHGHHVTFQFCVLKRTFRQSLPDLDTVAGKVVQALGPWTGLQTLSLLI